jgi:cytochrome b pre-mRNA-processing protein 3
VAAADRPADKQKWCAQPMRFARWFRPSPVQVTASALYAQLTDQARTPVFYRAFGVPDSLDGRYEMVALHAFITLRRLRRDGAATEALAQALFDAMFADMDRSLREIGVSDLSVGKRIKEMARGLYGRIAAYESALAAEPGAAAGDDPLAAALARNVYGTVAPPAGPVLAALARYVREAAARLDRVSTAALSAAPLPWPAIPEPA